MDNPFPEFQDDNCIRRLSCIGRIAGFAPTREDDIDSDNDELDNEQILNENHFGGLMALSVATTIHSGAKGT